MSKREIKVTSDQATKRPSEGEPGAQATKRPSEGEPGARA